MTRVLHHQRHPGPGRFSLERVFSAIRRFLPNDIEARVIVCPFESRGILRRAANIVTARHEEADVHHITGDAHYLALGLEAKKTLLTSADCVSLHRSVGVRRFLLWMFWYYLPIRRVKMVTTISEYGRNELLRIVKCDPGKVRAIHCPLPSSFPFTPLCCPGDVPIILQVGTGPTKNLRRVIEGLRGIRCRFWIVGHLNQTHGECLESSGIQYENFPQVSDDELVRLYIRSTIVMFASTYEGFGLPIIEAQAIGRPVIVSNVASMPEVAGGAAEFVDPVDERSIHEAVGRLIADATLRERLIALGRENVKRFDPRRIAEQYASIYREIAAQRGS